MRLCRGSLCTFNRAVHPPSTKVNVSLFLVTFHSHEPKVLLSQNVRLVEKPVGWNWGSRGKTDITRPTQRHKPLDRLCPKPTNPVQIGGCETVVKLDTLNIFILGTRRVFPLPARDFPLHYTWTSARRLELPFMLPARKRFYSWILVYSETSEFELCSKIIDHFVIVLLELHCFNVQTTT